MSYKVCFGGDFISFDWQIVIVIQCVKRNQTEKAC